MSVRRLFFLLILVLVCFTVAVYADEDGERDLYKILGLNTDATDAQIKKAFRKLSLKYHPDKNKGDEAAQKKFMDVSYAHEVLSDPDKRSTYDLHGEEGLKREKEAAARGGGGGGIFDLFGMGGMNQGGKRKGPDYRMEMAVGLEDLYNGGNHKFKISRKVICKKCKGSGAKGGETHTCPHCQGRGQVMSIQSLGPGFNVQMQTPCDKCGGRGKTFKHACPFCKGTKVVQEDKELELTIEKGMKDGEEIVFPRMSEQQPDVVPGDVIVKLRTNKHNRFIRDGDNLRMDHTLSLKEALLGYSFSFTHLDGRTVKLSSTTVTPPEFVREVKNEGFPLHGTPSEKGSLFVKFNIKFPPSLTQDQIKAIKQLFP